MKAKIFFQTVVLALGFGIQALANPDFIVEQNFASLFNTYRYAQPKQMPWAGSFFAYSHGGTAMDVVDGIGYVGDGTKSPIYYYDQLFNQGNGKAFRFEKDHHSCDNLPEVERSGCRGWYGHCNGWAAAAIKDLEPRNSILIRGQNLEVGHVKGLVTELWLTANSAFMGSTKKGRESGNWIYDINDPDYQKFWDVTPRQAFLSFTNHMGAKGKSMVIDRFAGDQVWNQPVVGYRILPIRDQDLGQQIIEGQNYHFAKIRMKIYWANDNVHPGHLSKGFDITKTSDKESNDSINDDYDQRVLYFKLFFDGPVEVDGNGTKIVRAGNLVGEGYWDQQENPSGNFSSVNHTHPDFIWYPESAYVDIHRGYGNPYLNMKNIEGIAQLIGQQSEPVQPSTPPRPPTPPPQPPIPPADNGGELKSEFSVVVERSNIYDGDNVIIAEVLIGRIFKRSNLSVNVTRENIIFEGNSIHFRATSESGVSIDQIRKAFQDARAKLISVD